VTRATTRERQSEETPEGSAGVVGGNLEELTTSGLFDFSDLAENNGVVEAAPLRLIEDDEARSIVVVVADGLTDVGALYESFRAEGLEVLLEHDAQSALHRARNCNVNVVVAAFAQRQGGGLALAESLALMSSQTRLLLRVSKAPQPAVRRRLEELGNTRLIAASALPGDLSVAVKEAVLATAGFHGSLFGVSLIDLLQMLHLSRRTATLHLSGTENGAAHFLRGEVIHAEIGLTFGLEAFQQIVRWSCGRMELGVLNNHLRTIDQPFELMLLDTLRRIDEAPFLTK